MQYIIAFLQRLVHTLWRVLPALSLVLSLPSSAGEPQTEVTSLRVRVNNAVVLGEADLHRMQFKSDAAAMAVFRKNVIPLRHGNSIQLQVEIIDARGKAVDVTRSTDVKYESLSPWKMKVTPQGLVTMAPDEPYVSDQASTMAGDTAIFISYKTGSDVVWNKVFLSIVR